MRMCLRKCLQCFSPKSSYPLSKPVQPRTSAVNSSTHISSTLHRSLKVEYPNVSAPSASATLVEENRIQTLPVNSLRPKLDEKTEKHFSSLMVKRKNKELICPESLDNYREVGGVLMMGKQLRQPVEDTF